MRRSGLISTALVVIAYAIAMGYLEAAVVVYLRAALGMDLGRTTISGAITPFLNAEAVREGATIVMIAAVGWLAGRSGLERLAWAAVVFGIWDIVYYLGLYAISGWPPTLVTWDVLFLLPVTWVGPIWAPVAVSSALIVGGLAAAGRLRSGQMIVVRPIQLAAALGGAALVVLSFLVDSERVLAGGGGPWTGWPLLIAGIALGAAGTWSAIYRYSR